MSAWALGQKKKGWNFCLHGQQKRYFMFLPRIFRVLPGTPAFIDKSISHHTYIRRSQKSTHKLLPRTWNFPYNPTVAASAFSGLKLCLRSDQENGKILTQPEKEHCCCAVTNRSVISAPSWPISPPQQPLNMPSDLFQRVSPNQNRHLRSFLK